MKSNYMCMKLGRSTNIWQPISITCLDASVKTYSSDETYSMFKINSARFENGFQHVITWEFLALRIPIFE